MSGKEAEVYLVIADGEERVAKIYKEAANRSFKHRAEYTEGRGTRNTRDQRAIGKRTAHGRAQDESAWRATEVHMIGRLAAAGVRVPIAYNFVDGVLVMELVRDGDGYPAPRLGDLDFTPEAATEIYHWLLAAVMRMLCAGVVHGDLSDFNVLLAADGPVVIDLPQAVDSAQNPNARKLLLRDVDNLHDFLQRFVKGAPRLPYAEEMWELYEQNALTPETTLTGRWRPSQKRADVDAVLALIADASYDERKRRDALGLKGGPKVVPPRPKQKYPQHAQRTPQPPPRAHAPQPAPRAPQQPRLPHASQPPQQTPQPPRRRRRPRHRRGGPPSKPGPQ